MVDSGANPNCISHRCFQASRYLRNLPRFKYTGSTIVDANGQAVEPEFVVKVSVQIGEPKIEFETEFVVIKSLPFSCILGQKTLKLFDSWEVSNKNKLMTFNKKHVVDIFDAGVDVQSINLLVSQKSVVPPFSTAFVDVKASGAELNAFRATTTVPVLVEGNEKICNRLLIDVPSSVNVLTHQNCTQRLKVHNLSRNPKTIAKGAKIATCSTDFDECDVDIMQDADFIGEVAASNSNVVDLLCNKITDLNAE